MASSSPSSSCDDPALTPRYAAALLARCASRAAAAALHARLLRCSRAFFCSPYLANCLGAAYSRLGAAPSAVALMRAAANPNVFSHNILLSALLGSGLLEDARRLFDEMPERDAVTYNTMVSGYVAGALPNEAFRLFCAMKERGVRPTAFTFSIVSSAVGGSVRRGRQLHAAAVRHGLAHSDAVVGNAFIDMYGRIGLFQYAARVFSCMEEPDVTSWNSVMSVYKDQALSGAVFKCFRSMRSKGFSADAFTASTVLSVCSDVKDFANGMPTWRSESCNALMSGYARSGLMEEALSLFAASMRNGVVPTEFTFASVLRWSSCFGLMEQGTQIHCLVCKLGFQHDVIVSTALTDMYCKLGLTKHARKIFSAIGEKDLVSWNTMLLGLLHNGRGKEALVIFRRMLKYGIQPDRITLFGALSACSLDVLVTEGMDIITLFKDRYHIIPTLEHYTCVVDMLCHAGMFTEAVNYVENNLPKFSAATFSNILEACIVQGNIGMAELVAEKMVMQKSRLSLPYFVLAQIYGSRCKWEKMAGVWRSMEYHRAKKVQSCSWLCIRNHIYVFTSEQILHHGKGATYEVLDLLFWDMMDDNYAPSFVEPKKSEGLGSLQLLLTWLFLGVSIAIAMSQKILGYGQEKASIQSIFGMLSPGIRNLIDLEDHNREFSSALQKRIVIRARLVELPNGHNLGFLLKSAAALCVDKSAVLPDLAASRVGDVAHLHHGVGELLEEGGGVSPVFVDGVRGGVAGDAGPHLLVGVEEALALDECLEVGVVKDVGGVAVHGTDVVITTVPGADVLQLAEVSDDGLYLDVISKSPTTASLAAMASRSAQETVPGHSASSFSLILSTRSNPFSELTFWSACFSPIIVAVSSSSTDPSQPCKDRSEFRCSASQICQTAAQTAAALVDTHCAEVVMEMSWKWRRSIRAALRVSARTAHSISVRTTCSTFGHVLE
ncbi:LOW QUALITY PROTEIN: hypothetical protein U9M48_028941 [Paspalum notatum var. saurae]|uniref:Pentatricopeptide repeat-containing protein n=1 Tax=Paspalum notatum var. saurae TaxID=547442 RepID=A0AAQ3TXQ6_PASNO